MFTWNACRTPVQTLLLRNESSKVPVSSVGEVSQSEPGEKGISIVVKSGKVNMKCPHLAKWVISSCNAVEKPYLPSLFELQEYCRTKDHRKCPLYLRETKISGSKDKVLV